MVGHRCRRPVALLSFALVLVGTTGALAIGVATAGSISAPPANPGTTYLTFSVTPTQDLVTGEAMTITVSRTDAGTSAGVEIHKVGYAWCAPGTVPPPPLPISDGLATSPAFPTNVPRTVVCTTNYHQLSSAPEPVNSISPPTDATGNYPSVSGTTFAQTSGDATLAHGQLACDATNPCTFALAVYVEFKTPATVTTKSLQTGAIYFLQTRVTFRAATADLSCGGAATGQFTSAGPDSLGQMAATWAVDACQAGIGGGKALTRVTTSGESDQQALCAFAAGKADLAYSAVGYGTASSPFNPANCTGRAGGPQPDRPYVAVPVGLNAVVLAHDQTEVRTNVANGIAFRNYPQLDITDGQLAQLLGRTGRSQSWTDGTLGPALITENPTLVHDYWYERTTTPPNVNIGIPISHHTSTHGTGVVVTSGTTATAFIATRFLHAVAPKTLITITSSRAELGTVANFSVASPRFDVDPSTGLVNILHLLTPAANQGGMPWALLSATDAGAIFFGMADFALQAPGSNPPVYVPADKTTMQAAVAGMTPQADGTLLPNPTDDATDAYPLTYVEYAVVPAQPLVTSSCAPRTQSELDLVDWLDYVTGAGQTEMPKGMAPLTTTLQAQAEAAIAKVGATPTSCTPTTVTKQTTGTGTGSATGTTTSGSGSSQPTPTTGTNQSSSGSSGTGTSSSSGGNGTGSGGSSGSGRSGAAGSVNQTTAAVTRTTTGSSGGSEVTGTGSGGPESGRGSPRSEPPPATDLANFKVAEGPSWLVPAVGMFLLFLLLPGLVLLASGRSPRQALVVLGRFLHLHGSTSRGESP